MGGLRSFIQGRGMSECRSKKVDRQKSAETIVLKMAAERQKEGRVESLEQGSVPAVSKRHYMRKRRKDNKERQLQMNFVRECKDSGSCEVNKAVVHRLKHDAVNTVWLTD